LKRCGNDAPWKRLRHSAELQAPQGLVGRLHRAWKSCGRRDFHIPTVPAVTLFPSVQGVFRPLRGVTDLSERAQTCLAGGETPPVLGRGTRVPLPGRGTGKGSLGWGECMTLRCYFTSTILTPFMTTGVEGRSLRSRCGSSGILPLTIRGRWARLLELVGPVWIFLIARGCARQKEKGEERDVKSEKTKPLSC